MGMVATMSDTQLLALAASLVATLFGLLTLVIGWVGSRVISQLDAMDVKQDEIKDDLHARITHIDKRLVRVETVLNQ